MNYSQETQDLLKTMMKESHLTNLQRKEIHDSMKNTGALPGRLPSTYKPPPKKLRQPKPAPSAGSTITGFKLRSEEEIRMNGEYEREAYRGAPIPRSADEVKDELSNVMAYGVKKIPTKSQKIHIEPEPRKSPYQIMLARFEELNAEVKDREEFIEEMKGSPIGKREIPPVKVQIAIMKKEMTDIDKKMKALEDAGSG